LNRGEALCFHNVKLHKSQWFGPVHVAFGRNNVNGEFWAIVSDEPTSLHTFEEYGLRFDIEENFLDDQSNGWNVQKSELRSVCALSRLWFILAVATLYVTAQGVEVVKSGKRRWVDPHWFRGNSYFRIGWDWVKTALETGWRLIRRVYALPTTEIHNPLWPHENSTKNEPINWSSKYGRTNMCRISFVSQPADNLWLCFNDICRR
jgi:hypothetical protein